MRGKDQVKVTPGTENTAEMNSKAVTLVTALSLCIIVIVPAVAGEVTVLGAFQDWTAYSTVQGGKKVCYMAATPTKDEGKYTKRGKIYAMVSHRPEAQTNSVVSVHAGYTFKEGSPVRVAIGSKSFEMFTHGDTAWAPDSDEDVALVRAMKAGHRMVIEGVSARNTPTRDTYSLNGFTAAYREISRACGVKAN